MCPVCLTTVGLYIAGGVSAGGLATYLAKRLRRDRGDRHADDLPALEAGGRRN
jgi:hypothetical protein